MAEDHARQGIGGAGMLEFLPEDIRKGLMAAQTRALRKSSRLSVHVGDQVWPILRLWDTGFSVDSARIPPLRGFVNIYNGPRHILQALVINAGDDHGETTYEFKRETAVLSAPARDYALDRAEAAGFLPRPM